MKRIARPVNRKKVLSGAKAHHKRHEHTDIAGDDGNPALQPQLGEVDPHADQVNENHGPNLAQGVQIAKRVNRKQGLIGVWRYQAEQRRTESNSRCHLADHFGLPKPAEDTGNQVRETDNHGDLQQE